MKLPRGFWILIALFIGAFALSLIPALFPGWISLLVFAFCLFGLIAGLMKYAEALQGEEGDGREEREVPGFPDQDLDQEDRGEGG